MSAAVNGRAMSASFMLQGTGSDVGKSLLVAGLCRAFTRRGLRVRPFKPQNMSNNAAVTADGGEIGRAQALQARACGVPPSRDMNPVLLKPQTDAGSQVVVQGEVWRNARAREYYRLKRDLLPRILESFERLGRDADLVLVEGAGSAAEVNLRAGDVANMGFAEAAGVPVALVGDVDRGGVIASLVGTMVLLSPSEREHVTACIINRFRGDVTLFDSGIEVIRRRTGLPCLGVVPYFEHGEPAAGGRFGGGGAAAPKPGPARPSGSAVPVLSRIANFDDLDPLAAEPDVEVRFVEPGHALPGDADLVVLPGSKATIGDMRFLRSQDWDVGHPGASSPRRLAAGAVRRLPDARAHDPGSRRNRRRAGRGAGTRRARSRNRACRRQAARGRRAAPSVRAESRFGDTRCTSA